MSEQSPNVEDLEKLQQDAVGYFLRAANPDNGLIADSSREGSPCSWGSDSSYLRQLSNHTPPTWDRPEHLAMKLLTSDNRVVREMSD
jgi:hypothetical protein